MADLGWFSGNHHFSVSHDINDSGQVVGNSNIDTSPANILSLRPFIYDNGQMTYVGSFPGEIGEQYGQAFGINDSGQLVGISRYSASGVTHAFLWSNGVMTDLGSLGGSNDYSNAYSINDAGQVAGIASADGIHDRGFFWQDGVMGDLGDLWGGSGNTRAYRINNSAQVVGETWEDNPALPRAFLWENATMVDLDPLQTMGTFSQALGINDRGEVVGGASQGA
jgi:probable HAF family extracellular repeat protein